jgi:hypothetical protein
MGHLRLLRTVALAAIPFLLSVGLGAQEGASIQQRLNEKFKLTTTTADRKDIVTAGDVVEVEKPGLLMYAVNSPLPAMNVYKGSKIAQGAAAFGTDFQIGMMSQRNGTPGNVPRKTMAPGEKCWVTGVLVEKDGVLFQLYTDSYDNVRYYASLKIAYPDKKKALSPDATMQRISEVLTVVGKDDRQAAPQPAEAAPIPAPAPVPAPMPEIVPPPLPADVPTVKVGQTRQQVIAALGQPVKTATVGAKEILFYKDMKVTLITGKVSNVE